MCIRDRDSTLRRPARVLGRQRLASSSRTTLVGSSSMGWGTASRPGGGGPAGGRGAAGLALSLIHI
eukprot:9066159-Alexandrium_andersonii.AAC.1